MNRNTKNEEKFNVLIYHNDFTPVLGLRATEQMELISIETENFEQVHSVSESDVCKNSKSELCVCIKMQGIYCLIFLGTVFGRIHCSATYNFTWGSIPGCCYVVWRRYWNTADVLCTAVRVHHTVIESCTELMMSLNVTISSFKFVFYFEIIATPRHTKCCSDKRV